MKATIIPVTAFAQNCSLIWCEDTMKGCLVDPGGDMDVLLNAVEKEGITLEKILCTHGHLDHVGAVAELSKKANLPIEGPHTGDKFWIDDLAKQAQQFGFPQSESFTPTRWLNDGDQVTFGNVTLEVLHCPGHTPGHVVFFNKDTRVAIVGDVLFQGSIGRTDFPKGNHADLINAIKTKLFPLGDDVVFIPGHGPLSTIGEERKSNPFLQG
ncbi:MBL fold metallo-hydrolase [Terasakiella pusilla]|jgi:glyoxylase-like metal-dependent hydrolase (beta-lactamase superfamily II)|uniref:MBL fold metallo-hydrolase n=1 Tax=Terasakiella pusilla TaxID=64973 RepID=UPI00048DEAFC|nr:MBL fold metallo-hydrolase [Terasakiella pusilla]